MHLQKQNASTLKMHETHWHGEFLVHAGGNGDMWSPGFPTLHADPAGPQSLMPLVPAFGALSMKRVSE